MLVLLAQRTTSTILFQRNSTWSKSCWHWLEEYRFECSEINIMARGDQRERDRAKKQARLAKEGSNAKKVCCGEGSTMFFWFLEECDVNVIFICCLYDVILRSPLHIYFPYFRFRSLAKWGLLRVTSLGNVCIYGSGNLRWTIIKRVILHIVIVILLVHSQWTG